MINIHDYCQNIERPMIVIHSAFLGLLLENTHWLQRQVFTSSFKSRKLEIVVEIERPTIVFHDYRQHIERPTIVFLFFFFRTTPREHTLASSVDA